MNSQSKQSEIEMEEVESVEEHNKANTIK